MWYFPRQKIPIFANKLNYEDLKENKSNCRLSQNFEKRRSRKRIWKFIKTLRSISNISKDSKIFRQNNLSTLIGLIESQIRCWYDVHSIIIRLTHNDNDNEYRIDYRSIEASLCCGTTHVILSIMNEERSKIVSSTYSGMPNKINKELIFDQLTISTSTIIRAGTFIRQTRVD